MIRRLRVRNFKSLRGVDLELGPLTVLVGPNMAGKSNIVEVLRFLSQVVFPPPNTQGVSGAFALRGGMAEVLWKGGDENTLAFGLEVNPGARPEDTWLYELEILLGPGGFVDVQKESLRLRRPGQESELIAYEGGRPWAVNTDGRRLGGVGSSFNSCLERAAPDWDGYPFVHLVAGWRFYQLIPALMKVPNQVAAENLLVGAGSNISAWLMGIQTRYPEYFNKVAHAAKDLLPGLQSLLTWPTQQNMVHLASHELGLNLNPA